jgi:hypothetical protein
VGAGARVAASSAWRASETIQLDSTPFRVTSFSSHSDLRVALQTQDHTHIHAGLLPPCSASTSALPVPLSKLVSSARSLNARSPGYSSLAILPARHSRMHGDHMLYIRAVRTRSDAVRDRSSPTAHAAFSLLVTRTTLDRLEQVFPIPLELCGVYCG